MTKTELEKKLAGMPDETLVRLSSANGHLIDRPVLGRVSELREALAAPELERKLERAVEALRHVLAWCEGDRDGEGGRPTQGMLEARVEDLRAEIRKAEEA